MFWRSSASCRGFCGRAQENPYATQRANSHDAAVGSCYLAVVTSFFSVRQILLLVKVASAFLHPTTLELGDDVLQCLSTFCNTLCKVCLRLADHNQEPWSTEHGIGKEEMSDCNLKKFAMRTFQRIRVNLKRDNANPMGNRELMNVIAPRTSSSGNPS
jgi:hypothetical protein